MSLIERLPAHLHKGLSAHPGAPDTPGARWSCRMATAGDEAFLREVFASTRALELSLLGPDATLRDRFIDMQMMAQRRSAQAHHAGAVEWVLCHEERPAGRFWLHDDGQGLLVIDICVLPAFRGQGGARACMAALFDLADAHGRAVQLHVLADNPVRHWYERLGFAAAETTGLHLAMTRLPTLSKATHHHEQA